MLNQIEFDLLTKRVSEGKKFLEDKWSSPDRENREWVRIWMALSTQLFEEMKQRDMFSHTFSQKGTLEGAEAHLELIRQQMINKGYLKKPKERRKRNDSTRSESHSLFESSPTSW